ncbi:Planctomycete cytochrome C [Rubripirellula tenax]|uniref:Planctomycete cytochrome C n=1 Tax=Rubripirellula tenax TaxID=2528015 RepID=A0A5C6FG90_9BACT|nr:SO2930 family diheme c-type cytochrome [Rubripirellula tenax]TWU60551.1 Planctomycete cytochrome C [Rubripirellula tenax]
MHRSYFVASLFLVILHASPITPARAEASKTHAGAAEAIVPSVYRLSPSDDVQYRLQELLISAVPGDVIEFDAGLFQFNRQIDITTDNLTLRGQGSGKTTLTFKGQLSGGQGIEATGNNFLVEGLAIEDTAGNAIKVLGARNVTFRDVRTEWTGETLATNGAYGLYPVQCRNVLIDSCVAIGASDSGIYVGQSRDVIVRGCRAERNVAGIEIENTVGADVYDNVATDNAGGLLVFDLPGLQQKSGRNVRLFRNRISGNNHVNFAAPGNIVAAVPPGTGLMILATDHVEAFDNDITDNQTASILLVSYLVSGKKVNDPDYDSIPEAVSIHDNRISGGGTKPSGEFGLMLSTLGTPVPDILFDGVVNPERLVDGKLPDELQHSIVNNGKARFLNFKFADLNPISLASGTYKPERDVSVYSKPRASLAPISLADHDPPTKLADKTVLAYRAAPKRLSEFGLFEGNGSTQQPVAGVVPYDLNTTLFTDHATKYRFIRVPDGASIGYTDTGVLRFPEGTVIAKTFAYPVDGTDTTKGERLLETRIELIEEGEWFGYSYQWNDDQTDASLLLGGGEVNVSWINEDGEHLSNRYEIPNANQCLNCHSQNAAYVPIGPTAMNMNRDYDFGDGKANQLDYLAEKHLLVDLPPAAKRDRMPVSDDPSTGSLNQRAHAWLDVNCAHCHSPQGTARTSGLDLRFKQSDPAKFGLWKSPVAAGHGSGGRSYDIVPGEPDKSILLYRIQSATPGIRMPSVGRNMVPTKGATLIEQWITAMPKDK